MNIRHLTDSELLKRTEVLVKEERRLTAEVIHHLAEIDARKLYCKEAFQSLFDYATKNLGYSESQAQRRIQAARLLRQLPELETKIESGTLSLSNIAQAQSFFIQEKKSEKTLSLLEKKAVLKNLENKSAREAKKLLLSLASKPEALMERTRLVTPTHTEVTFAADEKLMENLQRIKGLLAHSLPHATWAEVILKMSEIVLEKIDPLEKAKRATQRQERKLSNSAGKEKHKEEKKHSTHQAIAKNEVQGKSTDLNGLAPTSCASPSSSLSPSNVLSHSYSNSGAQGGAHDKPSHGGMDVVSTRSADQALISAPPGSKDSCRAVSTTSQVKIRSRYIPSVFRHAVWMRDGGRCAYVDPETGGRCGSRHGLEIEHRRPFSQGGEHGFENLALFCRNHNQSAWNRLGRSDESNWAPRGGESLW